MNYYTFGNFTFGEGLFGYGETINVIDNILVPNVCPVITNQRLSPYRSMSNDYLQVKTEVYLNNKLLNISGLPIELWLNYSGGWGKAQDYTTNRYGTQNLSYSCTNISDIDCCLGYIKVLYQDNYFVSNIVRFNFVLGQDLIFEIDAGYGYNV